MNEVYQASRIKRRRSTHPEVWQRRAAIVEIIRAMRPMAVRQCFYQATVRGLIEKTENGYETVQNDTVVLRRVRILPYDSIADNTRRQRKPMTHTSIAAALAATAEHYRKALWTRAECYCEVWLERDALTGVVYPVTNLYDVPLMVARGYPSLSFLHSAASAIAALDRPTCLYHCGDFDPSGVDAARNIARTLGELAPDAQIYFERLAVTEDQIVEMRLPSRPTKSMHSRAKRFGDISVELDAIPPDWLRWIVREAIERHLSPDELAAPQTVEESERDILRTFVNCLGDLTAASDDAG